MNTAWVDRAVVKMPAQKDIAFFLHAVSQTSVGLQANI